MKRESTPAVWSTPTVIALCVLLGALGAFAGRRNRPTVVMRTSTANGVAAATQGGTAASASAAAAATDAVGASDSWNDRWKGVFNERSTPARNKKLIALIEELAKTDPKRALALAQSVADWRLRDLLRNAAVRGWAEVKPDEAGEWALTTRTDDRRSVVEALMQGAARNPGAAVRVALHLCAVDTERAGDYGHYTIGALVDSGAFEAATRFGLEVGPEKYPFLLKSAFFQWGRNQPEAAMAALDNVSDPILRSQARGEAIAGWAWADAKSVAAFALTLPAGEERSQVLSLALPRWVEKDPTAASEWINQAQNPAEMDAGVAAMANLQSIITKQPSLAMTLAGGISNPADRAHTMRAVFRQWAQNDLSAAQQYIAATGRAEDRALLTDELKDLFPDR